MLTPPSVPCCDIGSDKVHPFRGTPAHTVVDELGFAYGLCDHHYEHWAAGLRRARTAEPGPGGGYAHRSYHRGRLRRDGAPCRG